MSEIVLTFSIIGVIAVAVGGYILWAMPKGKKGETAVDVDRPFELRCTLRSRRPHRLWARYRVAWTGPISRRYHYGVVLDLHAEARGEHLFDERIALGYAVPDDVPTATSTELFTSHRRQGNDHVRSASIALLDLGPVPPRDELVIRGTATASPGTELLALKLYVAR